MFNQTRQRVRIDIPDDADDQVRGAVTEIQTNAVAAAAPARLVDDPKCPHCVLVGLCLPDEHARLTDPDATDARLIAKDTASSPLYLTEPDTRLTKDGGRLVLKRRSETLQSARIIDVSHVIVFGNATVTSAAVRALTENGGSVAWCSFSGWPRSFAAPVRKTDARRRIAQVRCHLVGRPDICRAMLLGKLRNQRTVLRRLGGDAAAADLAVLRSSITSMERADDTASMLGIEGSGAKAYFNSFSAMLSNPVEAFDMNARDRRPPRDPVNALLSFTYSLLARDATVAVLTAGLDPYIGLLHRPGFARPALALDLMEEFRPIVADSAVIRAINNGEVREEDFVTSRSACALTVGGRRRFVAAYERRLTEEIRHPTFGYKVTYRRCLELQARFLAATLLGEIEAYRSLTTR